MTEGARAERTARLLIARLDVLAHAAGHIPQADTERLVELTSMVTMRAVALDLLEAKRAETIWHDARVRHPQLRDVQARLPEQLAA
jgi:hypothetical protein